MQYLVIFLYILAFTIAILVTSYTFLYRKEVIKTTDDLKVPVPRLFKETLTVITFSSVVVTAVIVIFLLLNLKRLLG